MLCAFIPPCEWKGGYPALGIALGLLGALMAIVKEVSGFGRWGGGPQMWVRYEPPKGGGRYDNPKCPTL